MAPFGSGHFLSTAAGAFFTCMGAECENGAAGERFSVCWDGKAEARTGSRKIPHVLERPAAVMSRTG